METTILHKIDFQNAFDEAFNTATLEGKTGVKINAGELPRIVGIYPKRNHSMPIYSGAMLQNIKVGDLILIQPPKGKRPILTILYKLPR